ncbi:hypothetical protein DPMN_035305 [Dreissena polymorpha]|uniref:Transposase n=1 Tax=Dreissena polymorpha TaxID=45954 RepID=A0A9D4M719_DREPO|nr:hypothetical protein DPMN_035305 [Dreissena polymorpha]
MIWGCITYEGVGTVTVLNGNINAEKYISILEDVGTVTVLNGNINAEKYISILEDNLLPVVALHFPDGRYIFQDDNAPIHRARVVSQYSMLGDIK